MNSAQLLWPSRPSSKDVDQHVSTHVSIVLLLCGAEGRTAHVCLGALFGNVSQLTYPLNLVMI